MRTGDLARLGAIGRGIRLVIVASFLTACGSAIRTPSPAAPSPPPSTAAAASRGPSPVTEPTPLTYAGVFAPTGHMTHARYGRVATLLADGRVLITGGKNGSNEFAPPELDDPTCGTFTATGAMTAARHAYAATLLKDGRVLITGGEDRSGDQAAALHAPGPAELYNPASGTFVATGPMAAARLAHTATLLADGRVLIAGGSIGGRSDDVLATAELYDPVTGTFRSTGTMTAARASSTATLLPNGRALVTGGTSADRGYARGPLRLHGDPAQGRARARRGRLGSARHRPGDHRAVPLIA